MEWLTNLDLTLSIKMIDMFHNSSHIHTEEIIPTSQMMSTLTSSEEMLEQSWLKNMSVIVLIITLTNLKPCRTVSNKRASLEILLLKLTV